MNSGAGEVKLPPERLVAKYWLHVFACGFLLRGNSWRLRAFEWQGHILAPVGA
jgi:hypothetical protein